MRTLDESVLDKVPYAYSRLPKGTIIYSSHTPVLVMSIVAFVFGVLIGVGIGINL